MSAMCWKTKAPRLVLLLLSTAGVEELWQSQCLPACFEGGHAFADHYVLWDFETCPNEGFSADHVIHSFLVHFPSAGWNFQTLPMAVEAPRLRSLGLRCNQAAAPGRCLYSVFPTCGNYTSIDPKQQQSMFPWSYSLVVTMDLYLGNKHQNLST